LCFQNKNQSNKTEINKDNEQKIREMSVREVDPVGEKSSKKMKQERTYKYRKSRPYNS